MTGNIVNEKCQHFERLILEKLYWLAIEGSLISLYLYKMLEYQSLKWNKKRLMCFFFTMKIIFSQKHDKYSAIYRRLQIRPNIWLKLPFSQMCKYFDIDVFDKNLIIVR